MKKVITRENERANLGADILLYIAITIIGYIIMNLSWQSVFNPMEDISILFFIFGFFSVVTYFITRRKDDYEFLIFALINICVAAFIIYFTNNPDSGYTLVDAVLIYSLAIVFNKMFHVFKLLKRKNLNALPKLAAALLLVFLGTFIVSGLYTKLDDGIIILAYYLITFGILSLFEPLLAIVLTNKKVERFLMVLLSYELDDEEDEKKKIDIVIKKNKVKKIVKKDKPDVIKKKKKKKETIK